MDTSWHAFGGALVAPACQFPDSAFWQCCFFKDSELFFALCFLVQELSVALCVSTLRFSVTSITSVGGPWEPITIAWRGEPCTECVVQ